jgi:hypothetical protein
MSDTALDEEARKKQAEDDLNGDTADDATDNATETTDDTSDEAGSETEQTGQYHKKKGRKKKEYPKLPAGDLGYDVIQLPGFKGPGSVPTDVYPTITSDQELPEVDRPEETVVPELRPEAPQPKVIGPQPPPPKPSEPPSPEVEDPDPDLLYFHPVKPAPVEKALDIADPDPDLLYTEPEQNVPRGTKPPEPPQEPQKPQGKEENPYYEEITLPDQKPPEEQQAKVGPNGEIILPEQTVTGQEAKPEPQIHQGKPNKYGFYPDEDPKKFVVGTATKFGYHDPEDNGKGSGWVGGLDTDNTYLYGVAVPEWVLRRRFGNNYAAMRRARVAVVDLTTGKRLLVPIVDVGPADFQLSKGIVADFTEATDRYFNNDGGGSGHKYALNIVNDAGADVNKDFNGFVREQRRIASGMNIERGHRVASAGYEYLSKDDAEKLNTEIVQAQKDQFAVLDDIKDKTPNIHAMLEELQKPHEGVNTTNQAQYREMFQKAAADNVRDYLEKPDMTDKEALDYASKDANAGTIAGEVMSKWLPNLQAMVLRSGMTLTQLSANNPTIARNQLVQLAKQIHPEANEQGINDFITHLVQTPRDGWGKLLAQYSDEANKRAGAEPGTNPLSIDINSLYGAVEALQPENVADYNKKKQGIMDELMAKNRQLRSDPRIAGTSTERWTQLFGQAPTIALQVLSGPLGEASMASDIFQASQADIAREHPDWTQEQVVDLAAKSSLAQLAPMVLGMHAFGGKINAMTEKFSEIESPLLRIPGRTAAHAAVGGGAMGAQQIIKNIAEGRSPGEGVLESAETGALLGVPGGLFARRRIPLRPEAETRPWPREKEEPPPQAKEEEPPAPPAPPPPKDESRRKPVRPTEEEEPVTPRETDVEDRENAQADAEINRDNDILERQETIVKPQIKEEPPAREEPPLAETKKEPPPPVQEEPVVPPPAAAKVEDPKEQKAQILDINRKNLLTKEQEKDLQPLVKKVRDLSAGEGPEGAVQREKDFAKAITDLRERIYEIFRPHYEELGARKLTSAESDPGTAFGALLNHNGELQLHSDDAQLVELIRNHLLHSKDPQRLMAKALQEEFYHLAHMRSVRDKYEKAGKPGGSAHNFYTDQQRKVIQDFVNERDRRHASGDVKGAEAMSKLLYDSMRIYGPTRTREWAPGEAEAELRGRLTDPKGISVRSLGAELVRQMTQVVHNNELSEKSTRFGRSILPHVLEYWQGVLNNMLAIWQKLKTRGTPESKLMLAKEIKEVRKTIAEVQRAIKGKAVPVKHLEEAISKAMAEADLGRARAPPRPEQLPGFLKKAKQPWEEFKTRMAMLSKTGESAMLDNPETRRLAVAVKREDAVHQRMLTDVKMNQFHDSMRNFTKQQHAEFGSYMKARETGQPLPAITPEVQRAVKAWDDSSHLMANEMERLNHKVIDENGKIRPFKRLGYGRHWPRMLSDDFKDMVANRNHSRSADYQAYIAKEQAAGRIKNEQEFLDKYAKLNRSDEHGNDVFSNTDRARRARFGTDAYDYSAKAALRYLSRAAKHLAQTEVYGQKLTRNHKDLFDRALDNIEASADLSGRQKEFVKNRVLQLRNDVYGHRKVDNASDWSSALSRIATGSFLGNPLTSVANLIGGAAHNLSQAGPKAFLQTIGQMPKLGKMLMEAKDKNILRQNLADQLDDLGLNHDQSWMTKGIRGYTKGMLKWGGQHATEALNRAFSMQAGKNWLADFSKQYGQNTPRSRHMIEQLDRLGIRGADVQNLVNERGSGTVTDEFLRQWVMQTHGSYSPAQMTHYAQTPVGRALLQFQAWSGNASRYVTREYVAPLARASKRLNTSEGAADFIYHLGRNIGLLGIMMGSGALVSIGRNLVLGRQDKDATIKDIIARVQQGDNGVALQEALQKAYDYVISSGIAGSYGNYADLLWQGSPWGGASWGTSSFRTKDPRTPASFGIIAPFFNLGSSFLQEGNKVSPHAINQFLSDISSAYKYGSQIGKNVIASTGLPDPWNLGKTQQADNNLRFLRMQIRQYESENPILQERVARQGRKPQFSADARNPLSSLKDDIHAALVLGDATRVMQLIDGYRQTVPAPEQGRAIKQLKGYIQSQLPQPGGGASGLENYEDFLAWAKEKLPPDEARQVFASVRTIANTAMETGLYDKSKKLRALAKADYESYGQEGTRPVSTAAKREAANRKALYLFNRALAERQLQVH